MKSVGLPTIALFSSLALPAAADWQLQDGSAFNFETEFEGTPLPGRFGQFTIDLKFEPQLPAGAMMRVTVDLAGIDMGDPDMNDAIAAPEWFNMDMFPQAVFESDDVEATASGAYVAHGELELKGTRRKVDVPFGWSRSGDTATMRGELTLQRKDFDIGSGDWASGEQIGNSVKLEFALQLKSVD